MTPTGDRREERLARRAAAVRVVWHEVLSARDAVHLVELLVAARQVRASREAVE